MGGSLTGPGLNDYYITFENFKTYINNIHKQPIVNQIHEGYLVNYKDYIELKELVYKYYEEKQQKNTFNLYDENETKWIDYIKPKKFKSESLEDAIKQIPKNQKFIIINNNIYNIIFKRSESEQEKHKIQYLIDKEHLILYSANKKERLERNL